MDVASGYKRLHSGTTAWQISKKQGRPDVKLKMIMYWTATIARQSEELGDHDKFIPPEE